MLACSSCDRHVRRSEAACPFCGAPKRDTAAPLVAALTLATTLAACSDDGLRSDGEGSGGTTSTSSVTATSAVSGSSGSLSASGGIVTTTTEGDSSADEDTTFGGGFIYGGPDGGGPVPPCDTFAQDCPAEEQCVPWANDGGAVWNHARCAPIDDAPDQVGDPCTAIGSGVSGIDSCDFGSVCWDVDPKTLEGICVAQCGGNPAEPTCDDPDATCVIANDGFVTLCLDACQPLSPGCPEGQGCYPHYGGWACLPDASAEDGARGQACDALNRCDPGLVCADATVVPGCMGDVGCCTETCDLSDPAGDAQCSAGLQCLSPYGGTPPAGYEDAGVCATGSADVLMEPIAAAQ